MSWNGFAKDGGKAMGEALKENTKLTELDLTNNRIDANGMAMFMVGLKTNETLQRLKVHNYFNTFKCLCIQLCVEFRLMNIIKNYNQTLFGK